MAAIVLAGVKKLGATAESRKATLEGLKRK